MAKTGNIILTGVSRGLGLEILEVLLADGYTVFGLSRNKTEALEVLQGQYRDRLKWLSYDLSDAVSIRTKLFKEWIGFGCPIHGYVNNAALAYDDIITNLNLSTLENMYRVNVFAPMNITKYAIRQMLLHKTAGAFVHVSSISVHTGYRGLAMYASSKGALEAFSKNTAREWGELGIRSNCLVAGFMETDMSASLDADQKSRIHQRTAMKKPTSLKSVAKTVSFLLSEEASSITGQNIFVDSGTI